MRNNKMYHYTIKDMILKNIDKEKKSKQIYFISNFDEKEAKLYLLKLMLKNIIIISWDDFACIDNILIFKWNKGQN